MGNVSSRTDEGSSIYLKDQNRLSVTSVKITNSRGRTLYNVSPNSFPATRYIPKKEEEDDSVVEYVQDPDVSPTAVPSFLLRLNNEEEVIFYFTFVMRQTTPSSTATDQIQSPPPAAAVDTVINSLTFIFASTPKELETLVTREFNANPNLHKNPNVDLVGDYSTDGNPIEQFEWSWKWRPPKGSEDKGGGWRNTCSFFEYDQRAHRLNTVCSFSFWVHNTQRLYYAPQSPKSGSPSRFELAVPTRTNAVRTKSRVSSSQSIDSRLSDSDTDVKEYREPPSPIEVIPENSSIATDSTALASSMSNNPVKVDINYQKLDEDMSSVDDGPLFRATMRALEQKTGNMRARMKKVLKKAETAKESQVQYNYSISAFMEALREASSSNANAVQPALDHYFENIAKEILAYEKSNADNLQRLIIDPIARLYVNDIKQVDSKKKDFEDESREYYNYVGRYLGQRQDSLKDKKRAESDSKYQSKRKNFELKRFDYSSFMQDLHGGRKDQEVLSHLTMFADAQARGYMSTAKKIETLLPQLDALVSEVREANKEYSLLRTGREERRRALENNTKAYTDIDQLGIVPAGSSVGTSSDAEVTLPNGAGLGTKTERPRSQVGLPIGAAGGSIPADPAAMSTSPLSQRVTSPQKVVRELESRDGPSGTASPLQLRKEGLLWSMGRLGYDPKSALKQQGWHKFWIVLDQGKLSEYINWKQGLEPHMDPIDLRVASVREARNAERRFCFEVITPAFTRVYQATSEDDMKNWIKAINNALQNAFESRSNDVEVVSSVKTSGSIGRDIFGKSSSYHGQRSGSNSQPASSKNVARHATVGERPSISRSRSSEERPARLLYSIRESDAGNAWCADCGSDSRVEWVSINLGIVVCIECSGIHRSLGTHISKIRSLTLDTTSFTQDVIELIESIGNRVSNMVWEATLDRTNKLTASATRDQRLKFITSKYVDRVYVQALSSSNTAQFPAADETLLASIKQNRIQQVLHALALKANVNAQDRSRSTPAVFLALAASDPASPSTPNASPNPNDESQQPRKSFPLAELLLQNGADIPPLPAPIPLSRSASLYLDFKQNQKLGKLTAANANTSSAAYDVPTSGADRLSALPAFGGGPSSIEVPGSSLSGLHKAQSQKLHKRQSTGASLASKIAKGAGFDGA